MKPAADEIWVIQTQVGHSSDVRPGLIIASPNAKLCCIPLSSQVDTIDRTQDFLFSDNHPDFRNLGPQSHQLRDGESHYRTRISRADSKTRESERKTSRRIS